jgi:hypothetical protein
MSTVLKAMFVLCRYHTPIRIGTLLAITHFAVLDKFIVPEKKGKRKEKKIFYFKEKI